MICFAWSEFPQYAARCIGELVRTVSEEVVVVATRPRVPIAGMEEHAGCRVHWLEKSDARRIEDLVGEMPRVLFTSGWSIPLFNRYRDQVHVAGGKVIAMSDNNYLYSIMEVAKALHFNLKIRFKYDGYFVPGRSGEKLLRFYGVPSSKIKLSMYAADDSLFTATVGDILRRPKKIIFVGQLCERKNPLRMCEVFLAAKGYEMGWTLDLYGNGPLKDKIPQGYGIYVHNFLQPEELASKYRDARLFCLPSLEEHWGVVVHEAALSGCVLLLSEDIGARADFLSGRNGVAFNPNSTSSIEAAFSQAMAMTDDELVVAQRESMELAKTISVRQFAVSVKEFCAT